jgi:hypothetical protein
VEAAAPVAVVLSADDIALHRALVTAAFADRRPERVAADDGNPVAMMFIVRSARTTPAVGWVQVALKALELPMRIKVPCHPASFPVRRKSCGSALCRDGAKAPWSLRLRLLQFSNSTTGTRKMLSSDAPWLHRSIFKRDLTMPFGSRLLFVVA